MQLLVTRFRDRADSRSQSQVEAFLRNSSGDLMSALIDRTNTALIKTVMATSSGAEDSRLMNQGEIPRSLLSSVALFEAFSRDAQSSL